MADIKDIDEKTLLESLPSLFYEFKDNTKIYTEEGTSEQYEQSIYPLFDRDVIDNASNSKLLYSILDKVPYYYIEPSRMISEASDGAPEEYILQDTRDCGINNVPSIMQDNSFWQTWFQNTWGYLYNSLILNFYNTLQYPYINENLFLNNTLYSRLMKEAFNKSTDGNSYIGFIDTEEENDAVYKKDYKFYGEETGCLDNIQDIVSQKIDSEYYLIDYKDTSTQLLNKWGESLYASGQMDSEELDSAKLLYRLQDIRNELFRRKLAGSKTLYSMIVDSIDRKGSFITTIKESEIDNREVKSFNSKRLYKVLSIPGITTRFVDYNSGTSGVNYGSLINTYTLESGDIPINTLVPLFYNSSSLGVQGSGSDMYNSDSFYDFSLDTEWSLENGTAPSESYRTKFLRDNANIIDWNNLRGINLSDNLNYSYDIIDKYTIDLTTNEREYETLDTVDDKTNAYTIMDVTEKLADATTSTSSVLDISADRVLYHINSIQESLGSDYPYVTYPIGDGNGLCLMDTYWLDYIEREIKYKSKVQDKTEVGVQLSTVKQLYNNYVSVDYDFFAISYTDRNYEELLIDAERSNADVTKESLASLDNVEIRDYKEGDRYALIWYCTVSYQDNCDGSDRTAKKFTKRLISVVSIIKNFTEKKLAQYTDSDYTIFRGCNTGILPFTYLKAVDNTLWKTYSGFHEDADGNYDFVDDLADSNYSTAMYAFSNYDNLSSSILNGRNPIEASVYEEGYCTRIPSSQTKAVYYITRRANDTGYDYYWSDQIRVISLAQFISNFKEVETLDNEVVRDKDTEGLRFYINPYLNYNEECASPLRHTQVLKNSCLNADGTIGEKTYTTGPTRSSILSSLITGADSSWLCNNVGEDVKSADNVYGYYLSKNNSYTEGTTAEDYNFSYAYIQGDNRPTENQYAKTGSIDTSDSVIYSTITDKNNIDCISITPYLINTVDATGSNTVSAKGKIQTLNLVPRKDIDSFSGTWDWSQSENKSIFLEFSFNGIDNAVTLSDANIKSLQTDGKQLKDVLGDRDVNSFLMGSSDKKLYIFDSISGTIKEHSMYLFSYGNMSLYITSDGYITFAIGDDITNAIKSSTRITWNALKTAGTYRVGLSINGNKVILCVNDEYIEKTYDDSVDFYGSFANNYIALFRKDTEEVDITTVFYGKIYSLRIYNKAMTCKGQMLLANMGTFRELYSLAPSNYKLAHTIYKDLVAVKEVTAHFGDTSFPDLNTIRLFTRGVWDSILIDDGPETNESTDAYDPKNDTDIYSSDGYFDNCIEQELISIGDSVEGGYKEYTKGMTPLYLGNGNAESIDILYRDYDNPLNITSRDTVAILNTLVEPMDYSDEKLSSGEKISLAFDSANSKSITQVISATTSVRDEDEYIRIPKAIDSSDDTFTYSADFNFNFRISPDMNMTRWLAKGSNVDLQCITKDNTPYVVTTLLDGNVFNTTKNNVVLPLVIPYQSDTTQRLYLDKFYFKNVVLDSALATFLDATNYYTEVRFPVLVDYTTDIYTEVRGLVLTESSDVTKDTSKTYYYISKPTGVTPCYTHKVGGIVFEQVGTTKDINVDIPVTEMVRGKSNYYQWDSSGNKDAVTTFIDGFGTNSLYFTKDDDGNFVPYNETTFDVEKNYYTSTDILKTLSGDFVSGVIYYVDNIVANKYYTKNTDGTYTVYNAGGNFSTLDSSVQLYEKTTLPTNGYVSKWDALRTLKTGTYYFTCKYPFQITPFTDDSFTGDTDHYYTTYYASCRFKVEVKRSNYLMDTSSYAIDGTPIKYRADHLANTIQSSANRYSPDDNNTFPHAKIDIDLYVLDCDGVAGKMNGESETYTYKWTQIASNHSDNSSILDLTKSTINDTIVITKEIPMFLEKSYLSPFFVSGTKRVYDATTDTVNFIADPSSADDDTVDPIVIVSDYTNLRSEENIKSYVEGDMDKQVLIAGKSYKLVFDYTAKVSEISFTDECYVNSTMSDAEKVNYSRLVNILDTDFLNVKDYMYDSDGRSFDLVGNTNLLSRTSGYKLTETDNGYSWDSSDFTAIVDNNSTFAMGNPYSRSSNSNYRLYKKKNSDTVDGRSNINNSFTYPYMVIEDRHGVVVPSYSSELRAIDAGGNTTRVAISETTIMTNHYNEVKSHINNSISSLKSKSIGLFDGFSEIEPHFAGTTDNTKTDISIKSDDCLLYGYYSSSRLLPLGNKNLTITRKSLYSNNLLQNSTFDNTTFWTINDGESRASYNTAYYNNLTTLGSDWLADSTWDDGEGKDVFRIINNVTSGKAKITLKYTGGSVGLNSIFESAINLKEEVGTIESVQAQYYYNGDHVMTVDLTNKSQVGTTSWYTWSNNTEVSISCDNVVFVIIFTTKRGGCSITKAVVRKCNTITHKLGFSDALNETNLKNKTSYVGINGHTMVLFKYPDTKDTDKGNARIYPNEYFPMQFNTTLYETTSAGGRTVYRPKSGSYRIGEFISSNKSVSAISTESRIIELMNPFTRRVHVSKSGADVTVAIHKYGMYANSLGVYEKEEIYSSIFDIVERMTGDNVEIIPSDDNSNFLLRFKSIPLNISDNKEFNTYNVNVMIDSTTPMTLSNEKFSVLYNSFAPTLYRKGNNYSVAITNIQLINNTSKGKKIYYELEFLPIIYSELKNHFSLNLLFYKRTGS